MKSIHSILSAALLATAVLTPALRAEPSPGLDSELREIERKALLKQYETSLQELHEAEKALIIAVKTAGADPDDSKERKLYTTREELGKWVNELKLRLAAYEPVKNEGVEAMTQKLDAIVVPNTDFEEASVTDALNFLLLRSTELDPKKERLNIVLMDKDNASTVTLNVRNVSLHTLLKLVAEQAGLSMEIGEQAVILRKAKDKETALAPTAPQDELRVPISADSEEKDLAFFEKKFQRKLNVRPRNEHATAEAFYATVGSELGIVGIAEKAASEKYGWKKPDNMVQISVLRVIKDGWVVSFHYTEMGDDSKPDEKKGRYSMNEGVFLEVDFEGNVRSFTEIGSKGER